MRTFGSMARVMRSLAALVITGAAASAQAQTGTLSVSVTEMGGGAIAQAQVALVGTTIGGLTGLDGKLLLRGVPAGAQTVRVLRVGFSEQKKAIEVPSGGSIGVEFQM